jgi:Domain of unknown function (DUF4192)
LPTGPQLRAPSPGLSDDPGIMTADITITCPGAAAGAPGTGLLPLKVRVGSPTSLLAVIPGLLGFDPGHSIVVIGIESGNGQVRVTMRYDVPDPGHPAAGAALADHAVSVLGAQGVGAAVAVGYGTDAEVAPVMAAFRECASGASITLIELLRAEDHRYWSYVCTDPACCPPEGTLFDVTRHPAARALQAAGARVLAGRVALAATLAAKGGRPGAAMRRATKETLIQLARCLSRLEHAGMGVSAARLTATLGQVAVRDAIRRCRAGESVPIEYAAFLTVALSQVRVRDDAWARMEPEYGDAHLRLWTDLTRLARPGYVAAPASLLAFCAWQAGNGAFGNVALDRALADSPRYSMALLLREALDSAAHPSMARLPMTPEEVAAAYDAAEAATVVTGGDDPPYPREEAAAVVAGEAGESDG